MHRFVSVNLSLARAQSSEERFEFIVRAVAFRPGIARKESRPALLKGVRDVRNDGSVRGMGLRVLGQLCQKLLDALLDLTSGRAWLPFVVRWIEPPFQFDQPAALALELSIARAERLATLHHGEQLLQARMPPFSRLRRSEASKRVKSSKTRRPPKAKGGLPSSVKVERIKSA